MPSSTRARATRTALLSRPYAPCCRPFTRLAAVLVASTLAATICGAQTDGRTRPALDLSKLTPRRDSFVVKMKTMEMGYTVNTLEQRQGAWVFEENAVLGNGGMRMGSRVTADPTLAVKEISALSAGQGPGLESTIIFANGRAKGVLNGSTSNGPTTRDVDIEAPAGTLNTEMVRVVLPLLTWKDSTRYVFSVFSQGDGSIKPVTLTAVASVTVTVPAGTFECWQIEQVGGYAPATFMLAKKENRVVQIGAPGLNLTMQLAR